MSLFNLRCALRATKATIEVVAKVDVSKFFVLSLILLTLPLVLHTGRSLDVNFAWDPVRYPGWTDIVRLLIGYFFYIICAGNAFLICIFCRWLVRWVRFSFHVWNVIFDGYMKKEKNNIKFVMAEHAETPLPPAETKAHALHAN